MFVIEAAAMLLFVSIASGYSLRNNDTINRNGIHNADTNDVSKNVENGNTVQISDERAEEIIKVLREKDAFPSSFTAEDINKTCEWLKGIISENLQESPIDYKDNLDDKPILNYGLVFLPILVVFSVGSLFLGLYNPSKELVFSLPIGKFILTISIFYASQVILLSTSIFTVGFCTGLFATMPPTFFTPIVGPFNSFWGNATGVYATLYEEANPDFLFHFCILGAKHGSIQPIENE